MAYRSWDEFDGFVGALKAREPRATWIAQQIPAVPITIVFVVMANRQGNLTVGIIWLLACYATFQSMWIPHLRANRHPPDLLVDVMHTCAMLGLMTIVRELWLPLLTVMMMSVVLSISANNRTTTIFHGSCCLITVVIASQSGEQAPMLSWRFFVFLLPALLLTAFAYDKSEQHQLDEALSAAGGTAWDIDSDGTIRRVIGMPVPGLEPGTRIATVIHPEDRRPDEVLPGSVLEYRVPHGNDWRWLRESVGMRVSTTQLTRSGVNDITDKQLAVELTEQLARIDHLTGQPNRAAHHALADQWMADNSAGHLLLIDFDGFKQVNETLGHEVGDSVLRIISSRLARVDGIAQLARLGGDEFGALVRGSASTAIATADEIVEAGRGKLHINDLLVSAGVSVGIASFEGAANTAEVYRHSSVALREAKREKGRWVMFDGELDRLNERHLHLAGRLPSALAGSEFIIFHQPKFDLATGRFVGTEALVRWQHPDDGLVMPADFLDLVKVGGHFRELTRAVLRMALSDLAELDASFQDLTVAVNVNSLNFREHDFVDRVLAELDRAGLAPSDLLLELTEDALVTGNATVERSLRELDHAGIRLSIDDFGTGYSSLSYLARLPVSEIKLDRSLVSNITTSSRDLSIVRAVLRLAAELDMHVIAEGIEDLDTLDLLIDLGCPAGQGYHLGRPVPLSAVQAPAPVDFLSELAQGTR